MSAIIAALQVHALLNPRGVALMSGDLTLTWAGLLEEVESLSETLQGVNTMGLFLSNGPQWVIADLASLATGTPCIPLPLFFSQEQIRHASQDAGVDCLVCETPAPFDDLALVSKEETHVVAGRQLWFLHLDADTAPQRPGVAKITYTSGTTGNPKGVPLSLHQMETVAKALKDLAGGHALDRALVLLPLSTLLENIGSVYAPILAGACIQVPDSASLGFTGSSRVDAMMLSQKLQQLRPTTAILVPQLLKLFIRLAEKQALPDSFRFLAVGGAPVAAAQLAQAERLGLPVYQGYGMSEASSVVAMNSPQANRPGSVGKPLVHCSVSIADDGEVLLWDTGFDGYANEQGENDNRCYRTGDLGYLDADGYLYISGRKREAIVTSYGRNVSPEWVEAELLSEPAIAQVAVYGDNRRFLTAVMVAAPGFSTADLQFALEKVNHRMPDYAQVLEYVIADQPFLPQSGESTANGRPCRNAIQARYQQRLDNLYETGYEQIL
ncbi:AMP-binding protein [Thiolapillus sp.]